MSFKCCKFIKNSDRTIGEQMRKDRDLPFILLVIVCFLVFVPNVTILGQTRQKIAQSAFPSVVLLMMEDENRQPISLGSGFFIREGIIATNLHVVEKAISGYAKIVGQETKHDIEGIVGIDSERDLVLLYVSSAVAPSLSPGDSDKVSIGDEVYVIGNPQGLEGTFSQGIISGIRKIGTDKLLQITAPVSPGSSGGPVLDTRGKVIGVAVATFKEGQNLNFAIPYSYISQLLFKVESVKPLSRANIRTGKSILDDFGERNTEGMIGTLFTWDYKFPAGPYSFTLRNYLRESVKDVFCLVVFYGPDDEPIDIDVILCEEVIPAGLAKRFKSKVDQSVQDITTKYGEKSPMTKIEFRILDFKILE